MARGCPWRPSQSFIFTTDTAAFEKQPQKMAGNAKIVREFSKAQAEEPYEKQSLANPGYIRHRTGGILVF
jgi:hypothetical protein